MIPASEKARCQFDLIQLQAKNFPPAEIERILGEGGSPLMILVGTVLSARTKDSTVQGAMGRLFFGSPDLRDLAALDIHEIEERIKPVGFFRQKAVQLERLFFILQERYQGRVPSSLEELLDLPGVGPKTAHLVRAAAFGLPSICVDIHVLRISNRLGWTADAVWTAKTMHSTMRQLETLFPQSRWILLNQVLVPFGQNICRPRGPLCSRCCLGNMQVKQGLRCPTGLLADHP